MILLFSKKEDPGGLSDEQLRAAAQAVRASMLASLKETEERPSFSESFVQRMRILFRIDDRRERRRRALQRAAVILIVFLLAGTLFLAFNPDARADLANWIRNTYENSVFYQFFSKASDEEETVPKSLPDIEFTWLPEEFVVQEAYRDDHRIILLLINDNNTITVDYWLSSYSEFFEIFTDDYIEEVVNVREAAADFYQGKDTQTSSFLVWQENNIVYCINSCLPKEDIIRIAEGIKK